jgi:two-component system, NtrC family, sensor kinase
LPVLPADQKQLEQVLLNLINNSLDAMPNGGRLLIETAMSFDQKIVIRVSDTGQGIEPSHLEKLFQPMFTTKDIGQGTGLGLTICQAIIKEHGGEIEVESTVGEGTTFSIVLPAEVPVLQT